MDFIDKIRELSARIPKQLEHIQTEEATKNAFVMPFLNALGYDVFNPLEVVPEFTTDVGTKKGEKVDYVIKKDNEIIILIECKSCTCALDDQSYSSQLYRYFSVTEARFAVLTNGIIYKFYSDIDAANKMDSKPFFEFNLKDIDESKIEELKKFTKPSFDLEKILTTASELKYTNAIKSIFSKEINEPSEDFVKFFGSQVYPGKMTQTVRDQFTVLVKKAVSQCISEKISDRLKAALNEEKEEYIEKNESETSPDYTDETERGIETTVEEIEGFNIVKALLRDVIDVKRIYLRDTKSYCGILLDDNNRKPICRLHFNSAKKCISLFSNKNEERIPIDDLNDIFKYTDKLKSTINEYIQTDNSQDIKPHVNTNIDTTNSGIAY